LAVLATATAAAIVPVFACAAWTDPAPISDTGSGFPELGVGPSGDIAFAWGRFGSNTVQVQTRVERPDEGLSPVQTLVSAARNTSYASTADVVVDSAGDAVYVWSDAGKMELRIRYADGTLGPTRLIAPPSRSMYGPRIAMDAQGHAAITWTDTSHPFAPQLDVRQFSVDSGFGPPQVLTRNYAVFGDDLAMDAAGDAFITWRGGSAAHTRVLKADGSLTPVQTLSSRGIYPTVAVDADGNAVYAWGGTDGNGNHRIQARRRASDGSLGPRVNVSAASGYPVDQTIALGPGGKAVIAWKQTRLRTRTLRANGTLSGIQPISPPKEEVREIYDSSNVVVDSAGNDIYAWTGSANRACVRVRSSGGLGPVQCLSPAGDSASDSRLAALPTGGAVLLWTQLSRDGQSRVETSFGP